MEDKKKAVEVPDETREALRAAEKALTRSLRLMAKIVDDDAAKLEEYYEKHGDIRYRPKIRDSEEEGLPTEIDIILKADSLGLAMKRIADTVSVIRSKLGVPSADEGEPKSYSEAEEREHEEDSEARAQRLLDEAMAKKERGE